MATNSGLMARTALVAEQPWKTMLRRTLQAVAGAFDRLLPPHPERTPSGVVQIYSNLSERMSLAPRADLPVSTPRWRELDSKFPFRAK